MVGSRHHEPKWERPSHARHAIGEVGRDVDSRRVRGPVTISGNVETDEIDDLLQRYTAAERRIAANLLDLHDHPTYALITDGAMTGTTARRLGEVAAEAPTLWTGLDALGEVLKKAHLIRGDGRMNLERRTRLAELLTGASVLVAVVETPLADRDLLEADQAERRITIEALLDELRDVYEPLRDGIAEIDAVWRDLLPRLDAADTTRAELVAEVATLGVTEPTVGILERRIVAVREMVMDDPLGLDPEAGVELDRTVNEAALAVGQLRQAHDDLDDDLARTEVLVAEARVLRTRGGVARAEALAKVAVPGDIRAVPSAAIIDGLARKGAELRAADGSWEQVRSRLDRWLSVMERLVAQLRDVANANTEPLRRRDQLRGLLSAYRAKAAAVGLIERVGLADLVDEAHAELYTAPTDLDRADRLVRQLGDLIRSETEVS